VTTVPVAFSHHLAASICGRRRSTGDGLAAIVACTTCPNPRRPTRRVSRTRPLIQCLLWSFDTSESGLQFLSRPLHICESSSTAGFSDDSATYVGFIYLRGGTLVIISWLTDAVTHVSARETDHSDNSTAASLVRVCMKASCTIVCFCVRYQIFNAPIRAQMLPVVVI
jgi:hypothetical protein